MRMSPRKTALVSRMTFVAIAGIFVLLILFETHWSAWFIPWVIGMVATYEIVREPYSVYEHKKFEMFLFVIIACVILFFLWWLYLFISSSEKLQDWVEEF